MRSIPCHFSYANLLWVIIYVCMQFVLFFFLGNGSDIGHMCVQRGLCEVVVGVIVIADINSCVCVAKKILANR